MGICEISAIYMKKYLAVYIVIALYWVFFRPVSVYASYMLPYPSAMPGNKVYAVTRVLDSLKKYWYFGDIAQTKYHLELSDKYLVEAKTLFEYQQYLLAMDALTRSDAHFVRLKDTVRSVAANGKNPNDLVQLILGAADTHIALLNTLQLVTPKEFTWKPEVGKASYIPIHELISGSKNSRKDVSRAISQ